MEKVLKLGNLTYTLLWNEQQPTVQLAKADIRTDDYRLLALMNEERDYFIYQEVLETEETLRFTYTLNKEDKDWSEAKNLLYHEQLRLLLNVNRFSKTFSSRLNVILHPDNLVYDDNLLPYGLIRGFQDVVAPFQHQEQEYLKQYKCLIIATLSKRYQFTELYEGNLPFVKDSNFLRSIAEAVSLATLVDLLETEYTEEKTRIVQTMKLVPKRRHVLLTRTSLILVVVLIIGAIPLVYFSLTVVPYQENLLAANEAFLTQDYERVIAKLTHQNVASLPQASKYELSYSYIQGEPLSTAQLQNIMGTTSLKSDERYLLFWIYTGQGNYSQAIDIALALGDHELVIYGVYKNIEDVTNDKSLGGAEKSEKLKALNVMLEEAKNNFLGDDENNSDEGDALSEEGVEPAATTPENAE